MPSRVTHMPRLALVALMCVLVVASPGCRGPSIDPASDRPKIRASWTGAFDSSSSNVERRLGLIEDGEQLRQALEQAYARSPVRGSQARVRSVVFRGSRAVVTYDVVVDGGVVLANVTGEAVKRKSRWLVSRDAFCNLVVVANVRCPSR